VSGVDVVGSRSGWGGMPPDSRETMEYRDKTLVCADCGQEFVFTAGEQEFYDRKGFRETPKRCRACREARKGRSGAEARNSRGEGGSESGFSGHGWEGNGFRRADGATERRSHGPRRGRENGREEQRGCSMPCALRVANPPACPLGHGLAGPSIAESATRSIAGVVSRKGDLSRALGIGAQGRAWCRPTCVGLKVAVPRAPWVWVVALGLAGILVGSPGWAA